MTPSPVHDVLVRRAAADYRGARDAALGALTGGPPGPDRVALLVELGRLHEELGAYDECEAAYREVLDASEAAPALVVRAAAGLSALLRSQGRPAEAEPLAHRALAVVDATPDLAPAAAVDGLVEAARTRQDEGDHDGAAPLIERAVTVAANDEAARSKALAARGAGLRRQGRYREAEPALRQALELAESAFGERSLEVANVLNELGITFKFSGRFDDAVPLYRRSLAIITDAAGGEDHPDVASLYHNLGGLEHARRRFDDAEPYARRSVEVRERLLGPDHVATAADRAAYASILDGLGRSDEAEALLQQALVVFERVHGPEHYEVAVTLNNLAAIAQRRGDLDHAEDLYRRSLAIKERVLGPSSPETGFTLNNLAVVRRRRGDLSEAEALYRRALAVLEAGLEPGHPSIATTRSNLARLAELSGGRQTAGTDGAHDAPEGTDQQGEDR